ncbi:FAS1-like dehydratase domain-containing protein [Mycobacterium marinum]|uniref:FAS1-like dehydratase domain-containing protein n=1 Tax=Mycobacterium marinum TaxID=1781 RepID=UPI000B96BDBF|nr:MaoC family dehydratase N-terminal domain-containing protein [Mycobacterium marinum]MDC8985092.1 MaoC family dehydratase N-terminal domain-containing protein [Mycobacterium marinum]MDC8997166.1 MaoC family dehydratase N-terminal domain-containing protein [Mycobacterium marinum]MDC9002378.1 MaoC family dehydratase N-terminal domain-containing protein [Mycobacterium marinum]MDC9013125.1 MaoC family dehydratase N-terminal domain-containing protein [Mycobacterium marinum]MDC9018557.1 MaoC famil
MTVPPEAAGLIGKHYQAPDYFVVGREKIREFATSIKDEHPSHSDEAAAAELGYPELVAPLTFLAIAGRRVQLEIFSKFNIPINIARVFHRDQKFRFYRPILTGDKLYFHTYLDSVLESHGTVIAEIRSEVTDDEGKPVVTSVVTMLGEAAHHEAEADAAVAAIASI